MAAGDIVNCDRCGVAEHIDLLDGAPPNPAAADFTECLCVRCYGGGMPWDDPIFGRIMLTWCCNADPLKVSVAPALAPFYEAALQSRREV